MRHFFFVIALSLHVGYALSQNLSSSSTKNRSHNLLIDRNNNSIRAARCIPCTQVFNYKRPTSNHLDPEYRGNGADNLGYDWSPMAWGGLAYPQRNKPYMGGSRGRDGKMMPGNWGRNPGNTRVACDTCRSYWYDDRSRSRGNGRQFDMGSYYDGLPGTWNGDKMRGTQEYETRVVSPTVGVLVKPGSRIAYIPSRSGEMYWDGVSGGGTRWDGFSNGISWIGNGVPSGSEWDRMDTDPKNEKPGYGVSPQRPENDYRYASNGFGLWDDRKGTSWNDNRGRDYYFSNGVTNEIDPQWRDRGYASNWHYGNTNQNGWNGNNMKWNYGKQWADNDRAANQFYFNGPQDRTYSSNEGHRFQYGNQYPNYQPAAGYPTNFRPQPSWPTGGSFRPNDRFPSSFQQGDYGGEDNRPWDYTSRDQSGYRRPSLRPEWARPGPGYPSGGKFESGKFPLPQRGYDKFSSSDKNGYDKPWTGPSGYRPEKPTPEGSFPYGGNRYPDESGSRPSFPMGEGHLFYPNEGNGQPNYPEHTSGGTRPTYPTEGNRPGGYANSGNQIGAYPGNNGRPSEEFPSRPTVIYTGGKPSGGTYINGGFPNTNGLSGGYSSSYAGSSSGFSIKGSRPGLNPATYAEGTRPAGYPGGGTRPDGYYSSGESGNYPGGMGNYPSGGSSSYPSGRPGIYPSGGSGSYPGGGSSSYPSGGPGTYPSGGSGSYPSGGSSSYPSGGSGTYFSGGLGNYPSGSSGSYPGNGSGGYSSGGSGSYLNDGFPSRPGYPDQGNHYLIGNKRPSFYPAELGGSSPSGYASEPSKPGSNRPQIYHGAVGYPQGSKNPPKGYYTGFITELGPDGAQLQYGGKNTNYFGGSYPGDKNSYSDKDRDRYFYGGDSNRYQPNRNDRFPGYPRGGGYPVGGKDGYDSDRDKFYHGHSGGGGQYPGGFPANHRYPGAGSGSDFDRNQGSTNDKNAWNYGQNDHKEGIYRRSGGSYPPYRGGQYYTSSYLASMSTTAGSTPGGTEPKTQSVTKADEVTQPTPDSS